MVEKTEEMMVDGWVQRCERAISNLTWPFEGRRERCDTGLLPGDILTI
jgi:hypothetical protein